MLGAGQLEEQAMKKQFWRLNSPWKALRSLACKYFRAK